MSTLNTSLDLTLRGAIVGVADLSTPSATVIKAFTDAMTSGIGLEQADTIWADERTLAATTSENLDLSGALTNDLGATAIFAKVKVICVHLKTLTAGYTLSVGGAASDAFINWVGDATDIIKVGAGGIFLIYNPDLAGYAVTASTGDILKVNNTNAASVTYDIIVIGTSA